MNISPAQLLQNILRYTLLLILTASGILAHAKEAATAHNALANKSIVSIQNAWVRPTNAGQEIGAAYMTFVSQQDVTLVQVESNVTKSIEIHSMSMQKGVMKMRMLETLPLTTGKPYKLAPNGFHLMLFDLKKPLLEGDQVSFELTFRNKNNGEFKQKIKAPVQASASHDNASNGDKNTHEHH